MIEGEHTVVKRLCIYLIYDKENIIDRYITYFLREIRTCCTELVVVCNAKACWERSENAFCEDQVIYRDNIGYDAGGYKDALCSYIGWEKLEEYDELLLINDSFYGPLYPIQDAFAEMSAIGTDYWGLTRSWEVVTEAAVPYGGHIQSYFLVFGKKVISSSVFKNFWEQMEYPKTMEETVRKFEIGINVLLKENGFQEAALTDQYNHTWKTGKNENPYLEYSLELIRDCKIPILKYKSLLFGNKGYINALKAFQFIEENNLYPIQYIKEHFRRKSKWEANMIDVELMERFYATHRRIFIYGHGICGKNVAAYFQYRGWQVAGFLVTCVDEEGGEAVPFAQKQIEKDDGIIVAVGKKKMLMEIEEYLKDKCETEQVLFPNL